MFARVGPRDLPALARQADVVAGVGKPAFVQGDWIKPGAIVLDVGIVLNKSRELPKPEPSTRFRPGRLQRWFGAG
jgi:5,10-methylene-tetrahydrofolate dehydrogenase/methenyl tetrahydrofolate cyclohydrolase